MQLSHFVSRHVSSTPVICNCCTPYVTHTRAIGALGILDTKSTPSSPDSDRYLSHRSAVIQGTTPHKKTEPRGEARHHTPRGLGRVPH